MVKDSALLLAPVQQAFKVSGSTSMIAQALQAALGSNSEAALLTAVFSNAFNSIKHSAIQAAIKAHCPYLEPFSMFAYGQPSEIFLRGMAPGAHITSTSGVKQGDPLSTFLFCLTLQDSLLATNHIHPAVQTVAFADDVHLVAPVDQCPQAFRTLMDHCAPLGLDPNHSKCRAFSFHSPSALHVAQQLQISHATDRVMVCGAPIGSEEFVTTTVTNITDHTTSLINKLLDLALFQMGAVPPFPAMQDQSPQVHCPMLAPLSSTGIFEAKVSRAALRILNMAPPAALGLDGNAVVEQLRLSIRMGGFGLDHTSAEVADSAWLSMAARCDKAFEHGPASLRPFTGDGLELYPIWHALLQYAPDTSDIRM